MKLRAVIAHIAYMCEDLRLRHTAHLAVDDTALKMLEMIIG
jgi:hypothetical protein